MTVFGGNHLRLTTLTTHDVIGAIEALMVFFSTLKTCQFPFALAFTMSEFLTPRASHWIREIWTYLYIVKTHANGSGNSWGENVRRKVFIFISCPFLSSSLNSSKSSSL
jgi:hypothetical protein